MGAHEAREAAALNRMAETTLAPFLGDLSEEPSLKEKMDPYVQQVRCQLASGSMDRCFTLNNLIDYEYQRQMPCFIFFHPWCMPMWLPSGADAC